MTGPLFTQFELIGANALTAGSFDASVSFDANTPLSHYAYSLGALGSYFSPGDNSRPNAVVVNGSAPCPPGEKEYTDILGFRHCGKELHSDDSSVGASAQGAGLIGNFISPDMGKRLALFIVAVVILAVALWKM